MQSEARVHCAASAALLGADDVSASPCAHPSDVYAWVKNPLSRRASEDKRQVFRHHRPLLPMGLRSRRISLSARGRADLQTAADCPATYYEVVAKRTDVGRLPARARRDIALKIEIR